MLPQHCGMDLPQSGLGFVHLHHTILSHAKALILKRPMIVSTGSETVSEILKWSLESPKAWQLVLAVSRLTTLVYGFHYQKLLAAATDIH